MMTRVSAEFVVNPPTFMVSVPDRSNSLLNDVLWKPVTAAGELTYATATPEPPARSASGSDAEY